MNQEMEELPEILKSLKNKQGFLCPNDYFIENINKTIERMDLQVDNEIGFSNANFFQVPKGYFESNISKTLDVIALDQEFSQNTFAIPDYYFDQLGDHVLNKIKREKNQTPVRKFNFGRTQIISIAAMFVFMLSLFLYRLENKNTSLEFNLSLIDDDTLIEFIAANDVDLNSLSELVDEQSIPELNLSNDELDDQSINELIENY